MTLRIFIGWDSREAECADVLTYSLKKHATIPLDIRYLKFSELDLDRPLDPLQSTEFTYSRFIATGDETSLIEKLHAASQGRLPVADRDYLRRFDKRIIAERYLDLAERVISDAAGFEIASNDIESAHK